MDYEFEKCFGDWKWIDIEFLKEDLKNSPEQYVYWLKAAFAEFYMNYKKLRE